jgi:hypothetical protein
MKLNGATIRERFDEVLNGIRGAVDYVTANFHVETLSNLPYSTILVPLSVFFAASGNREAPCTDAQRTVINRWFWRSCLGRRYSSGVLRNLKYDIEEISKLRDNKPSALGGFSVSITSSFFTDNVFTMGAVNTNTFILLLAHKRPDSFVSGSPIDLREKLRQSNRAEFHHLMPKAFIEQSKQSSSVSVNCLANFAFISRADNRQLGGVAPSAYKSKMPASYASILERAICPNSLFDDNYVTFIAERAELLKLSAEELCI